MPKTKLMRNADPQLLLYIGNTMPKTKLTRNADLRLDPTIHNHNHHLPPPYQHHVNICKKLKSQVILFIVTFCNNNLYKTNVFNIQNVPYMLLSIGKFLLLCD